MTPQAACRFRLKFGKYKGWTLGDVYAEDRAYIVDFLQCIDWKNHPECHRRTTQSHVCSMLYYLRDGTLTDADGNPTPEFRERPKPPPRKVETPATDEVRKPRPVDAETMRWAAEYVRLNAGKSIFPELL